MSVVSKATLLAFINANITTNGTRDITGAKMNTILSNMVDSLMELADSYTTVQRDAIASPATGQLIYNTDNDRYEFYDGASWQGVGMTRHESPFYLKGASNTDVTANESGDWRIAENSGSLIFQKFNGSSWVTMSEIS